MDKFSGVLDPPSTINHPPKTERPMRHKRHRDRRKRCPYCLWDLTDYDPEDIKERGNLCPLCRHAILENLLSTPVYEFTRAQQWDLLANELEYIWKAEHCDVDSYSFWEGPFYNPDYGEAKKRLYGMLAEKDAVVRLEEEFIEAEGEMDLLIIAYLNKLAAWRGDMARRLFAGRQWRLSARRLSMTVFSEKELAGFQLGFILACPWGAYGSPDKKEKAVVHLEKMLENLTWDQGNMGA